jgi:hypothetical protein
MSELIDFSFVIIALAIFGFIIKDSFFLYRRANLPYELRDEGEKLFANVTIGLWILSFLWLLFVSNIQSLKSVLDPFYDILKKWVDVGILPQSVLEEWIKNFIIFGNFLTIGAFLFLFLITGSMIIGFVCMYLDKRYILVKFDVIDPPKKFRRIIKESEDFFYFESFKNFRKWTAVPKTHIVEIKNVLLDETEYGWLGIIRNHCNVLFNRYPAIKSSIGDFKMRRLIILIDLILLVAVILISAFLGLSENVIIKIITFVLIFFLISLILIHESFYPFEPEDD